MRICGVIKYCNIFHGDSENGIEAAGHTGQKEIAHFLLEKGARINLKAPLQEPL